MTQEKKSSNRRSDAPIFLIGFMGVGKTTVGGELARQLEYDFCDLDELIAARVGKSVQQIFEELGEAEFRRLEREAIRSCEQLTRAVIALGGGAYASEENRVSLREIGRTVWLDCPLAICLRRVSGDKSRPLLGGEEAMRELLVQRRGGYAEADYVVEAGERTPEQLAIEIAQLLGT
jgi:shikimate kinase